MPSFDLGGDGDGFDFFMFCYHGLLNNMVIHAVAVHIMGLCLLVSVHVSSFLHILMSNSCKSADDIKVNFNCLLLFLSPTHTHTHTPVDFIQIKHT